MSEGEDDILFRIGFESHPQAGSKLEALAQAVELTQKRIDQMFVTTSERVAQAVTAMTSTMAAAEAKAGGVATIATTGGGSPGGSPTGGGSTSGKTGGASQLEAMAAARKATQATIVRDTREFNTAMEMAAGHEVLTLKQRNEGAALYSRARQAIMRGEAEMAKESLEQKKEQSREALEQLRTDVQLMEDILNGGGGSAIGATPEQAAAAVDRVQAYYNTTRKGLDQQAADEAKLADQISREQTKQRAEQDSANRNRRKLIESSRRLEEQAARQTESEIAREARERDAAAIRRRRLIENTRKAEEQAAKQAEMQAKKEQAEQDTAINRRRKLIENSRKMEEAANKQAAADAKKQQAEQDAAINRRRKLIEASKKYEQQLARETAEEAIDGYEQEQDAATRAATSIQQGRQRLLTAMEQGASGLGKLARSAVLLGLANGEQMEGVIKQLAAVQAGIDLISGTTQAVRGAANAFEGLRLIIMGRVAAQRAETAAGQQAIAGSTAIQNALRLEALNARDAATAHLMLARARNGQAMPVMPTAPGSPPPAPGTPPGTPGTPQGGGRGSFVAGTIGAIAGAGLGALAGSKAGDAIGGDNGQQIGTVIGTIAGGIIGQVIATKMLAGLAGRGVGAAAGALSGRVGGALMGGAGSLATSVGASGVGGTGAIGTAIGGSGAALAAAGTAALAGVAFALKSTIEVIKDSRKSGFGGGSEAGSYNDTVGGSKFNPFSVFIAWNQRAELAQNEEKTKRMEAASALFKMEQEHLRNLQKIRIDFASQREGITRQTNDAIAQDQFGGLRTTQEKLEFTRGMTDQRTQERDQAAQRLMGVMEDDPNTGEKRLVDDGGTGESQKALDDYIAANERLIDSEKQREQLERQIAAENRQNTIEEIKGIEDVIRARQKEMETSERQYMTAKERFGAMNQLDQTMALKALEKARSQGVESLSKVERDRLGSIGTEESQELTSQANQRSAERAGFDEANKPEFDRRQEAQKQAQDADIDKLAEKSGQGRDQIEQRLAKPVQIDLVDRTQLEVTLNKQDDVLFDAIMQEIKKLRLENAEAMKKRLDQALQQAVEQEQQANAANRQNATA